MSALRSMSNYDPQNGMPRSTVPVSVFNRSVEETQSASVVLNGYLWQESLLRMLCEEMSIIQSSAVIANEEVQRMEELRKRAGALRWLEIWREEGDEEEQRETLEYLKQALDEDRLSYRKLFP